ncbi:Gfo/Idh/MocA family protein [Robertmurraya sp. GLU-23]
MKKEVKVAMIGIGAIGERVLRKFQYHSGVELVAVCDHNAKKLQTLKEDLEDVSLHTDYVDMLQKNEIDLVYIAVPPKYHHEIALYVIKQKKHVLCEKPLANSLNEALEMLQAAREARVTHAMNFPMVYTNVYQLFKDKVLSGEIGEVKRVEVHLHFTEWPRTWQKNNWISSREQGGFIREVAPHYIQMIHDMLGELRDVTSFVDYPEDESLCETSFVTHMKLQNGVTVLFNGVSGIGQKEHLSFKVFGEKGTLDLTNWSQLSMSSPDKPTTVLPIERTEQHDIVMEILNAIEGKEAKIVTFEHGYQVQQVLEKILKK